MNPETGFMGRNALQLRGATHVTAEQKSRNLLSGRIKAAGLRFITGHWKMERKDLTPAHTSRRFSEEKGISVVFVIVHVLWTFSL